MIPNAFRELARSLPDMVLSHRLGSEEIVYRGSTIGTVGFPDPTVATVRLSPEDQARFIADAPVTFSRAPGGPGVRGGTQIRLGLASEPAAIAVLQAACRHTLKRNGPPQAKRD